MRITLQQTRDEDVTTAANAIALLYRHMPDRDARGRFGCSLAERNRNAIFRFVKALDPEDLMPSKVALKNARVSDEFRAAVLKG